jgi:hypothetical protein
MVNRFVQGKAQQQKSPSIFWIYTKYAKWEMMQNLQGTQKMDEASTFKNPNQKHIGHPGVLHNKTLSFFSNSSLHI